MSKEGITTTRSASPVAAPSTATATTAGGTGGSRSSLPKAGAAWASVAAALSLDFRGSARREQASRCDRGDL
jgi:hypothetical protein